MTTDASTAGRPLKVLLVDDQTMMRAGFAMILSVEDDIEVVGQAGNGAEAISKVAELHPDVVLMDVQMPVLDGSPPPRESSPAAVPRSSSSPPSIATTTSSTG